MTTLIIAEKALAGKALAAYLSKTTGQPQTPFKTHVIVGDKTIAWLAGHVLELVSPETYSEGNADRSNFSILPIVPDSFMLKVVPQRTQMVSTIKDLLKHADDVVHFGDPDREGQLIGDELLRYLGNKKPVSRLWTTGLNDASLAKSLAALKDNSSYRGLSNAALARSHADWLYGINMSRAVTISARRQGARSYFTVGRVQTPTLALVCDRELKIKSFKPTSYFEPWIDLATSPGFRAHWSPKEGDVRLSASGLLEDVKHLTGIKRGAGELATVVAFDVVPGTTGAPHTFSLCALQVHCSRIFGFSGAKTLHLAESLYLKKIMSYPRSDSDLLPESMHLEAPSVLTSLAKSPLPTSIGSALRGAKPSLKSKVWDDAVEKAGHHAIVPLHHDNPAVISELSDDEKKVYFEVVKRYVLQFWPVAKFLETKILLEAGGESYKASGRRYTDEGWRKAFTQSIEELEDNESSDANTRGSTQSLPQLVLGKSLPIETVGHQDGITKPLRRFTDGSLLSAMKSNGLGTEATRAETIKVLFERGFIELCQKDIVPTAHGMRLVTVLPSAMTTPDMTALWESSLESIVGGSASYAGFMDRQKKWLQEMVASSTHFFDGVNFEHDKGTSQPGGLEIKTTTIPCLTCGSLLRHINGKHGWFFGCSNNDCKKVFSDKAGIPVERAPKAPVHDSGITCPTCKKNSLARRERIDKSGFFWSCLGWRGDKKGCNAIFNDTNSAPDFSRQSAPNDRVIKCPGCHKGFLKKFGRKAPNTGFFWSCSDYKEGCKWACNDLEGKPDVNKQGGTGKPSSIPAVVELRLTSGPTSAPPSPVKPSLPERAPSGNRFLDSISGRGVFGGADKKKK